MITVKNAIEIQDQLKGVCSNDPQFLACEMAIDALEKQIPKKVIFSSDGYADGNPVYDLAECPKCGFTFEDGDGCWESTYCPNCGQRLDWELAKEDNDG